MAHTPRRRRVQVPCPHFTGPKVYGLLVPDITDVIRGFVEDRKKLQILVLIVVKDGNGLEETVTLSLDFTVSMVYPPGGYVSLPVL